MEFIIFLSWLVYPCLFQCASDLFHARNKCYIVIKRLFSLQKFKNSLPMVLWQENEYQFYHQLFLVQFHKKRGFFSRFFILWFKSLWRRSSNSGESFVWPKCGAYISYIYSCSKILDVRFHFNNFNCSRIFPFSPYCVLQCQLSYN